jgi:hypothetical protein
MFSVGPATASSKDCYSAELTAVVAVKFAPLVVDLDAVRNGRCRTSSQSRLGRSIWWATTARTSSSNLSNKRG